MRLQSASIFTISFCPLRLLHLYQTIADDMERALQMSYHHHPYLHVHGRRRCVDLIYADNDDLESFRCTMTKGKKQKTTKTTILVKRFVATA